MEVSAENQARISFPSKMAKGLEVREKIITLHKRGMNRPLAWGIVYTVGQCTDAPILFLQSNKEAWRQLLRYITLS